MSQDYIPHLRARLASMSGLEWQAIDDSIFANQILLSLKQIRSVLDCQLKDSLEVLYERYGKLRMESPDRFVCSEKEYWEGFYS